MESTEQGYQPLPKFPGVNHERPKGGTSGLAIAGFVLSLVGVLVISAVLCLVALNRVKTYNEKGRGLAIAGLVLSGLWIVVGLPLIAYAANRDADRDTSGQVTTAADVAPKKLRVGDCVARIAEGKLKDVRVQPCSEPNGGRVFAVFELPSGKFPGLAAVQQTAEQGCADRWEAGDEQASTPSDLWYFYPTMDSWRLADYGVTCLITPS